MYAEHTGMRKGRKMDNLPKICPWCGRDGETAETTCMEWEMYRARKNVNLREEVYQRGVERGKEIRRDK